VAQQNGLREEQKLGARSPLLQLAMDELNEARTSEGRGEEGDWGVGELDELYVTTLF
jgi:hypothetical protein